MTDTAHAATPLAGGPVHPLANPRRTTLARVSSAQPTAPARPQQSGLTMVGDDAGTCADGSCALPG